VKNQQNRQNLRVSMPRGLKKLYLSFDEEQLTHYGGMFLIKRFCKYLHLRWLLENDIPFTRYKSQYHPADVCLAILYAIIVGLERINKTELLQYNGAFLSLLGIERYPDQTTLRRFLKRLTPREIRRLVRVHDQLRESLFHQPESRSSLTFDIDSTVLVIYGRKQGAAIGYNPKKPGRRSYQPLLCFEAQSQEFWHGSLRPGNINAVVGAAAFIEACMAKVPSAVARSRIRFRADAGLYSKTVIETVESQRCGYAIVAKLTAPLKTKALGCRFQRLQNGWETGEFNYQPLHWQRKHRYIVVRRPIPDDPEEAKQLTLFKDKKYAYHVVVTNLTMEPWRVWRFYAERANIEKIIRELVYDYPLSHIPTSDWVANVAFFQLVLFAYNIVHWFKRLFLPLDYHAATVETIRAHFLIIPAKLAKQGSRNVLHLPKGYHYRREFEQVLTKLGKRIG
jgi:hypothetical protein